MAFDWTQAGFFGKAGDIIAACNLIEAFEATLAAEQDDLRQRLDDESEDAILQTALQFFDSHITTLQSLKSDMATLVPKLLEVHMVGPLDLHTTDPVFLKAELRRQMEADGKAIERNAITVNAADYGNTDSDHVLYVSKKRQDDDVYPAEDDTANEAQDLEGAPDETFKVICVQDVIGGATAGQESYEVRGQDYSEKAPSNTDDYDNQGAAGTIRAVNALSSVNLLMDGGLEAWDDASTPTSWDVDAGTVAQGSTDPLRGTYYVALTQNDKISQTILQTKLRRQEKYFCSFAVRAEAAMTGTLTVSVSDPDAGWTPGDGELYAVDLSTIDGDGWVKFGFFFNLPKELPASIKIEIELTGAGSEADVEDICLSQPDFIGGYFFALTAGETNPLVDEWISIVCENNHAGLFQSFFARYMDGWILPSAVAASNPPLESWAE